MNRDEIPSTSVSGRPRRLLGAEVMERWHSEGHREGPIFLQLAWFLTNLIIEGELDESELLPSETTLADQFGMSRMTARRGIEALKEIGVVSRSRRGTRIEVSADEAAMLSDDFWHLLTNDQTTISENRPLRINQRLDSRSNAPDADVEPGFLRTRPPDEDLTSRSRRLERITSSSQRGREAYLDEMSEAQILHSPSPSMDQSRELDIPRDWSPSSSSRVRQDPRLYERLRTERDELENSESGSDQSIAAVGVGKLGHEVVAHLVANLIEQSRVPSGGRPIPGLRVIGVDGDKDPFIQARSPIRRALRSLGRLARSVHLGPEVDLVPSGLGSLALREDFKNLELCFLVSALADSEGNRELPGLIRALDKQGTKTIALVSIPEDWESNHILSAAKDRLDDILTTNASVIAVPISSIATLEEDLAWEDHLLEIVYYFSLAFETLLRASSWSEGASNITLTDIYSVLSPGHQATLSLSQVSGIERSIRIRHILDDGVERLRRQNVDLNETSRILAILSGSRSFTRSEVQALMEGIQDTCGQETEVLLGTSRTPIDPDTFYLTLIA